MTNRAEPHAIVEAFAQIIRKAPDGQLLLATEDLELLKKNIAAVPDHEFAWALDSLTQLAFHLETNLKSPAAANSILDVATGFTTRLNDLNTRSAESSLRAAHAKLKSHEAAPAGQSQLILKKPDGVTLHGKK